MLSAPKLGAFGDSHIGVPSPILTSSKLSIY
jgi:hypothetical protein